MLISLRIQNFALIDELELKFGPELNVLTGETGAGKSILLDALDAALGGKATSRMIRSGTEQALVEATFQLSPWICKWLDEQEIEDLKTDSLQTLTCCRELGLKKGGLRSRSRLNGVIVNRRKMERLRDRLVEITAQGQTLQLGDSTLQRSWLDAFGGAELLQCCEQVQHRYGLAHETLQTLERRRQDDQQRLQQLDLLEYQVKELSGADLTSPDELSDLQQERQRLSHSVELKQQSYQVYQALYQNEQGGVACADLLGQAEGLLNAMVQYDPSIQATLDLVSSALAQVEAAGWQVNSYGESLETDPARLQEIEQRIGQLKQICRKYGPTLKDAISHYEKVHQELVQLKGDDQPIEELEQSYQIQQAELTQSCERLTDLRRAAASRLEMQLVQSLKPLAMDKVSFKVEITPGAPTVFGADQVRFVFSANPGEPLQPLDDIASGGEMSRFLLALKTCFSAVDQVSTMVFDEVDVGVSGRVAQAIAEKLHQLSQQHQVLCVTHQPIVAAMADSHFRVEKRVQSHVASDVPESDTPETVRTVVRVTALEQLQRREELAQLAGGQSGVDAIAFAESLLTQAANIRRIKSVAS